MEDRVEVRPSRANLGLALLGSAGFVLLGLSIMLSGAGGIAGLVGGALSVGFFGYCGTMVVATIRRPRGLTLTPEALYWRGPTFSEKRIGWEEIEGFAIVSVESQKFNAVALKDAAALVARFDAEEARRTTRVLKTVIGFARASQGVGLGGPALARAASGRVATLGDAFGFLRAAYGGEILLGWADRDRGAEALDALLRDHHARFG